MTTAIVLSVVVPSVAGLIYLALRKGFLIAPADVRGIALQTVIIMVVLLAVAGAVAGVLLARGGEAVEEVQRQDITREASEFSNERLCNAYGFSWAAGTCYSTLPTAPTAASFNDRGKPACEDAVHLGNRLGYTWTDDPNSNDPLSEPVPDCFCIESRHRASGCPDCRME